MVIEAMNLLPYLGSAERLRRGNTTSHVLNVLPTFLESVQSKIQNPKLFA
ncbi:hypothetical protein NIES3974_18390 [Calothrix sp. NIES-3974]|nr:hypothetical protein NIES3974_18390 [Calothrix sp. NIES-3974]